MRLMRRQQRAGQLQRDAYMWPTDMLFFVFMFGTFNSSLFSFQSIVQSRLESAVAQWVTVRVYCPD